MRRTDAPGQADSASALPLKTMNTETFPDTILAFVVDHQTDQIGRYRYAASCPSPTVYSSCYAALARGLLGDLNALSTAERESWIAYLQGHQDDDGLFRDPVIFGQGWYHDNPLWCGRSHLTCHVLAALPDAATYRLSPERPPGRAGDSRGMGADKPVSNLVPVAFAGFDREGVTGASTGADSLAIPALPGNAVLGQRSPSRSGGRIDPRSYAVSRLSGRRRSELTP